MIEDEKIEFLLSKKFWSPQPFLSELLKFSMEKNSKEFLLRSNETAQDFVSECMIVTVQD